jgi:hypothetical protein
VSPHSNVADPFASNTGDGFIGVPWLGSVALSRSDAFTIRICSTVRQRTSSSRGFPTR